MRMNDITMSIVITTPTGEHTAREYNSPHNRQTYVEGREGSNFILRLTNTTSRRVLAIPSVDGLSVLDGKAAGKDSGGYILDAHQTLDIPGWKVDGATAAQFFFAGKKNGQDGSYAALAGADTANKGVVGLRVLSEKYAHVNNNFRSFTTKGGMFGSSLGGAVSSSWNNASQGTREMLASYSTANNVGIAPDSHATMTTTSNATGSTGEMKSASHRGLAQPLEQTLGTGFGEAKEFATTAATFERGDLLSQIVIYYDDARGLRRVGIDVSQPMVRGPSAFPADVVGCVPPQNWNR